VTAAAHNYEDLHRLVDQLRPEQAEALRAVALQLVSATSRPVETRPTPPPDEGLGQDGAESRRRYRRFSFAGTISAEPDLAERSEEIIEEMLRRNAE
jgi:hypothetical protein